MAEEGDTTLGAYLGQLTDNPDMVNEFRNNPERAMREAGLSVEHRDMILRGDLEEIRQALRDEFPDAQVVMMVWMLKMVWPH